MKKSKTVKVPASGKPRAFELNQTLVRKGHQVHVRSERKMSRDRRRTEVFCAPQQCGFDESPQRCDAQTLSRKDTMQAKKLKRPAVPLVLVGKPDESLSIRYTRYLGKESTHAVDAAVPLSRADVESFRTDPDAFYASCGLTAEEPSGTAA